MNYGFIIGSVQQSLIYHILAVIAGWFSRQWQRSPIIGWFLRQPGREDRSRESIFYRLFCLCTCSHSFNACSTNNAEFSVWS